MKQQMGPSPQETLIQAQAMKQKSSAQLDAMRAQEIQSDVQGTSASKQLDGVALLGQHKAQSYGQ
jgi:hypothetical protein